MRIAVVGGGMAGLAAAWELREQADVVVFEPGRPGGRVLTEDFGGSNVDLGPDAFLTRVPEALDLCRELGLDDLVSPAAGRSLLWMDGRLRELPEALVLGVLGRLGPLIRSRLLSPLGLARAAGDFVLPRRPYPDDLSVRELVSGRFGDQVADRLVGPLVGSIHAGSIAELSSAATVPQLLTAARASRSLSRALRALPAPAAGPIFAAPRKGMAELPAILVRQLTAAGVEFQSEWVSRVVRDGSAWRIEPSGDEFDGVILAVASRDAATVLGEDAPPGLNGIESASVGIVVLGYHGLDVPERCNGVLIPASSGMLITAVSFGSAKWPHWAGEGRSVLRVSVGRFRDERAFDMSEDQLRERVVGEVGQLLRTDRSPEMTRVCLWPNSFPQYRVGHMARVDSIERQLETSHPGIAICGSAYRGVGIPACIRSGRTAATRLLRQGAPI